MSNSALSISADGAEAPKQSAVSAEPGIESLAGAAARIVTDATGTDVCVVYVLDDTNRTLTLAGATPPFDHQAEKIQLPLGSGVAGWVASCRRPVVISHDKQSDPRYLAIEALPDSDFTSMMSVPIEAEPGGLVGVLDVYAIERREFTTHDIEILTFVGRLVGGALHQARLHRRLVGRERAHEHFVEQVIEAQELERRRLAADIHDGISQRLVTLAYRLDAAAQAMRADLADASEQLDAARGLVALTLAEARAAIGGLRPPVLDDLGLAGGLASLARTIPQIDIEIELADSRLPEHIEVALYRIAQECLQNVIKHADATTARMDFAIVADAARLEIADDGIGFNMSDDTLSVSEMSGYGLLSMTERAELVGGRLNIRSRRGSGTTVTATIPLTADCR